MAAISSAQPIAITLTPPSSSHGEEPSWTFVGNRLRDPVPGRANGGEPPFDPTTTTSQFDFPQTGNPPPSFSRSLASHASSKPTHDQLVDEHDDIGPTKWPAKTPNSPPPIADDHRSASRQTSARGHRKHDDNSQWIHRDKLAKIESEELQAAGIFTPKPRAAGKHHRRDQSHSRVRRSVDAAYLAAAAAPPSNGEPPLQEPRSPIKATTGSGWDLRTPDEVSEHDGNAYFPRSESKSGSRIPVPKSSHVPIPPDYLAERKRNVSSNEGGGRAQSSIPYPKPRSRSASIALSDPSDTAAPPHADGNRTTRDGSPTRHAGRKPSGGVKTSSSVSRPRMRTDAATRDVSSTTATTTTTTAAAAAAAVRPTTRGGFESSAASKQPPEGDPPWLINSYKPDPRLPPDQQLLPTVARRLQQEKWEREGRLGDAYDKNFRPLNDNDLRTPEREARMPPPEAEEHQDQQPPAATKEWPLRTAAAAAAAAAAATTNRSLAPRQGSYSTMPKISDKPPVSPVNGPRTRLAQTPSAPMPAPPPTLDSSRHNADPDAALSGGDVKKEGCACCLVM